MAVYSIEVCAVCDTRESMFSLEPSMDQVQHETRIMEVGIVFRFVHTLLDLFPLGFGTRAIYCESTAAAFHWYENADEERNSFLRICTQLSIRLTLMHLSIHWIPLLERE